MKLDSTNKVYIRIKVLSNKYRFKIFELVSKNSMTISEISLEIGLSYDKCREYIKMLEEADLVSKKSKGREVYVSTNVRISFEKV